MGLVVRESWTEYGAPSWLGLPFYTALTASGFAPPYRLRSSPLLGCENGARGIAFAELVLAPAGSALAIAAVASVRIFGRKRGRVGMAVNSTP